MDDAEVRRMLADARAYTEEQMRVDLRRARPASVWRHDLVPHSARRYVDVLGTALILGGGIFVTVVLTRVQFF